MPGTIERNIGNLHDQDTGKLVGYRNPVTGKDESLDAAAVQALVSGAWIVNTRDGLGRATSVSVAGVTYTITYTTFGPATISGGGIVKTINRTAGGQVTSIAVA